MSFSQALLWQKGPVANIWTAAYCLKKLRREQIAQTDIVSSVDQIITNKDEISYRVLAHLLVGIVKIFSKKVEFLEEDCNVTFRTLTESFQAVYWKNRKKSKHGWKRASHVAESSAAAGTCTGIDLLETLRAHCDQVVVSVPARFELDLFDLEITDDCDAPDRHQLSAQNADKTLDESNSNFVRKTYINGSGCQIFFSTSFTMFEDVIPAEMMTDLDLDITDLYASDSDKRENTLNPNNNASVEQHEESMQDLHMEDPIIEDVVVTVTNLYSSASGKDNTLNPNADALTEQHDESGQNLHAENPIEADAVEPSVGCRESLLNPNANASADQHQESAQNLNAEDTSGEAEAVVASVICHGSPLKDTSALPEEKEDAPITKNMHIKKPLHFADVPTGDKGKFSPKPMVQTPARRETSRNWRKRKASSYCDQEIVLLNDVMRNALNDPSDLVYEKRKRPRTCLEAWRIERFRSVDQLFTEPLIPCTFSTAYAKTSNHTPHTPNNCNNEPEKPPNMPRENFTDVGNVRASELEQTKTHCTESEEQASETVNKAVDASDRGTSWSEKVRRCLFEPGTPESGPHRRSTDLSDWGNERNEDAGFGSLPDGHTSDATLSSLDSELGDHDGDGDADQTNEDTAWSVHTRYVAHHLHKKTSKLKRRNQESVLSLEQMLQGKKRKTCARFFYETLMLKGRGMVDVKQDLPYADIKISATPQLFEELGDSLGPEQDRRKKMRRV